MQISQESRRRLCENRHWFWYQWRESRDVKLMKDTVGADIKVKAAGGMHTYEEALANIEAGASRLGVSAAAAIVEGAED